MLRNLGLCEIVIDPARCPSAFAEFSLKEHMRDRGGSWIDDIPLDKDHSIVATNDVMMDVLLRG